MIKYICTYLFAICSILSCSDQNANQQERIVNVNPNQQIVDSVYLYMIDSLGLTYEITTPRMIVTDGEVHQTTEYPSGLTIVIQNRNKGESSISCGHAYVDENFVYWLKDDVRIVSDKGDILETSALSMGSKIETDKLVRLIQMTGDTSYGFGLEANEDFSKFRILNGYAGKVKFDDLKDKLGLN